MLQTVVGNHYVASGIEQQLRSSGAVATHCHGNTGRANETRLVANLGGVRLVIEQYRLTSTTPIATTDHARPIATRTQCVNQNQSQWRFTSTARCEIAHHDHRATQPHRTQPA